MYDIGFFISGSAKTVGVTAERNLTIQNKITKTYVIILSKGGYKMTMLWGSLMIAIGLFLLVCGSLKSQFLIYRLLVSKSRILWGEKVYRFHQVSGILVIIFGILYTFGII